MELLEKIKESVGTVEEETYDLLRKLTGCVTTDYNEANGQLILEDYLKEHYECKITRVYPDPDRLSKYPEFNTGHTYDNRYCVVAEFPGSGGGRSLILNAHMDTVFPASPDEWLTNPYEPVEEDGKIYALGAADDKGGMCAMLMALKLLNRLGIKLKGDVIFESVVDEEAGGGNGSLAVIDAGFKADAALVAEPNLMMPASAQIGSYAVKITVEGKSAHGNMKHLGVSAFEKSLPLINELTKLEQRWGARTFPLLNKSYVSVLQIKAGDGSITLPPTCEMLVNYTYYPDGYDYSGELMSIIDNVQEKDPWLTEHPIKVELHHDCGPYYTDPSTDWPQTIAQAVSEALGTDPEIIGLPTGADSRLYANVGHMPCAVLGPGTILVCHNPNEYIEKKQLMDAVIAYAHILCKWCGV